MKTKMLLATLALSLVPAIASAACSEYGHSKAEQVTMSCAEGTVYDAETQRCVTPTG